MYITILTCFVKYGTMKMKRQYNIQDYLQIYDGSYYNKQSFECG